MTREFENVWAEIMIKANGYKDRHEPILSLGQKIPQFVSSVSDKGVYVLPDHPKAKRPQLVPKTHFFALWSALIEDGQAGYELGNVPGWVYYVAYALLAAFIEGIEGETRPTALILSDRSSATRLFVHA